LLRLADIGAGTRRDGRQAIVADVVADRPRRLQASVGDAQFAVFRQGFADQRIQRRIVELSPPGRFEPRAVVASSGGTLDMCRFRLRRAVIGADRAGASAPRVSRERAKNVHARASL